MPAPDPAPRLLRAFLAVAEELHFTRAAARLFVAQQALSRDIRRLERELGAELFVRTTRQVSLTPDGERLLPYARRALDAHDALAAAFSGGPARPLLVDLNSDGTTAARVLERARELAPECELMARFESGLTWAASEILAGRLDVSFGRAAGLAPGVRAGLSVQPVRYEPMALMLQASHPSPGVRPSRCPSCPGRPSTRGRATSGRGSGRTSPRSCSPRGASNWPRPFRSPWGWPNFSASSPRRATRFWRWWTSRRCRVPCCARSSIPFRFRR